MHSKRLTVGDTSSGSEVTIAAIIEFKKSSCLPFTTLRAASGVSFQELVRDLKKEYRS